VLPPGLYEALFELKSDTLANADLISGDWVMRCESRTLDDIRSLGVNSAADRRRFETAARISETNLALYRNFVKPFVTFTVNAWTKRWMHEFHPLRLQYELLNDANPVIRPLGGLADWVRDYRQPVGKDNPFLLAEQQLSKGVVAALDTWTGWRDTLFEQTFLWLYGSPMLQAAVGVDPEGQASRKATKTAFQQELLQLRIAELKSRIPAGGLREAVIRALIYIGLGRNSIDERGFELVRRIRSSQRELPGISLAEFKNIVREQYLMLLIDPESALASIPAMLSPDKEQRDRALELIGEVLAARGEMSAEDSDRSQRVARLFQVDAPVTARRRASVQSLGAADGGRAKAS